MNRWVLSNILLAAAAWITLIIPIAADEGMHPISGIKSLNLKSKGLAIDPDDIFNPDKICLVDGV